jgi:hypothetical protein
MKRLLFVFDESFCWDGSDVLNRITRELATDTVEISNLDSQVPVFM